MIMTQKSQDASGKINWRFQLEHLMSLGQGMDKQIQTVSTDLVVDAFTPSTGMFADLSKEEYRSLPDNVKKMETIFITRLANHEFRSALTAYKIGRKRLENFRNG